MAFGTQCLIGQSNSNSPYSRFGIGDPVEFNLMYMESMGGIGAAYTDAYHINPQNPASYSSLLTTSFDVGVFSKYSNLREGSNSDNLWSGNLRYFSLAFPLRNAFSNLLERVESKYKLAMAFTLIPHSEVGYNITSFSTESELGRVERNFSGDGGSNKFMWGTSLAYKKWHFGVNLGYLFGKINYQRFSFFNDLPNSFDNEFITDYRLKGFVWNGGAIYRTILNANDVKNNGAPKKELSVGIYGNTQTGFNTTAETLNRSVLYTAAGSPVNADTLLFDDNIKGSGTLPAEVGVGLMYYNGEKQAIGLNFSQTFWSQYANDANPETLKNSYKVSFGGYWRPNYKSYNNFFKRAYYRYGLYYNTDPRVVDQKQINEYGATMGMGFPFVFQRKISHANLGLKFGLKGQGTLIEERFMRISFSFNFNDDEWFIKRKYN